VNASAGAGARALIVGLVEGGVKHLVLAPGSRSAPLVYAAVEAETRGQLTLTVRIDERVAAFTALGIATATGTPAAVATTSGTAVANLHPAVVEASEARVPLVVVSADRPAELHGVGANQTTDQRRIFGAAPVWERTLSAGLLSEPIKAAAVAAVNAACGKRSEVRGPAHINVQFREPLAPSSFTPGFSSASASPNLNLGLGVEAVNPEKQGPGQLNLAQLNPVQLESGPRTLVVAGFGAGPAARELAQAAGWPLLAEPASGSWGGPNLIPAGRLAAQILGSQVERAIVFGRPVLSRPVVNLLQKPTVASVIVHPGGGQWFGLAANVSRVVSAVVPPLEPDAQAKAWLENWLEVGHALWQNLVQQPFPAPVLVAQALADVTAGGKPLVVGASSAIRDLDLVPSPSNPPAVFAMRGAAGIDGTISFAAGLNLGLDQPGPVRVLLGDLTWAHDVGALLVPTLERQPQVQAVVLGDGGGGIFETLEPATQVPPPVFERFFATPVQWDWQNLTAAYGVGFTAVSSEAELRTVLADPPDGFSLVLVQLERGVRRGVEAKTVEFWGKGPVCPSRFPN
jgi:2-succinyl-5-enolpyruvyl-6-hydroxy-3-cyclohexene-1-carboxylate synthase